MVKAYRSALLGAAAFTCLLSATIQPVAAAGDPRPPISDFLSLSTVNEWVTRVGLLFVRSAVGLTYEDITNDPYLNRTIVTGVVIRPGLPWDKGRNCQIHAERLTLQSAELGDWDRLSVRAELLGTVVPLACLPPQAAGMAAVAEVQELAVGQVFVTVEYLMGSSALQADYHLNMPGLATITGSLDVAYFAIQEDGPEPVVMDLAGVSLAVEDLGLWAKAKTMMPPEMTEPNAAAGMVEGGLTDLLSSLNPPPAAGVQPTLLPAQAEFVAAVAAQVRDFAANGGSIVVETRLARPIRVSEQMFDDPAQIFATLHPTVTSRPAAHERILDAGLLMAGLNDPASLSDEDKLRVGRALVSGAGAPRSPGDGQALLKPLADSGNGEAALALASSLRGTDAETAYRYAVQAGAGAAAGASGVMDRLEKELTTPQVLVLQAEALSTADGIPSPHDFVPLSEVRNRALAHMRGAGAVRSYGRAYYWALLGNAAGDQAAASLAGEIESRMRHRGDKAAAAWAVAAEQARAEALAHWLTADYPAKLAGK